MIGVRLGVPVLALLLLTGCASVVSGTPTWPGATLEKVLLTATDFPAGVQFDRIIEKPGEPDGTGAAPSMLSNPQGCSDGLTRVIARSAERGPGSAGKYVVSYDGARMVITVLTSPLPLDELDATAQRCAQFRTFFDPSEEGIPITTTRLATQRPAELVYQQTMRLSRAESSAYFAFENIGSWSVFGVTFPSQNPSIAVKATLPQTFLDAFDKQVLRVQAR